MFDDDDDGIPFEQLRERVFRGLGDGCRGHFDFVSGTMAVDFSSDDYRRAMRTGGPDAPAGLSADDRLFFETCMHEYFHYLQLLGSGFLFQIARDLHKAMLQIDTDAEAFTDRTIREFARASRSVFDRVRRPDGASGLTALDLVEGSACLFGARMAGRATSPESFLAKLERPGLADEYRRAYRYAHGHMGDDAYVFLILLTGIALLYERPVPVYESLVEEVGRVGRANSGPVIENVMRQFADTQVGGAIEVPREEEGFGWYSKPLQAIEAYIDAHGKTPVPIVFDLEPEITEVVGSPPLIARDQNTADAPVQLLFAAFSADLSASPTLAFRLPVRRCKDHRGRSSRPIHLPT